MNDVYVTDPLLSSPALLCLSQISRNFLIFTAIPAVDDIPFLRVV